MNKTKNQLQVELEQALDLNKRLLENLDSANANIAELERNLKGTIEANHNLAAELSPNQLQIVAAAKDLFSWKWKVLPDLGQMKADDWTKLTGQFTALKEAVLAGEKQ